MAFAKHSTSEDYESLLVLVFEARDRLCSIASQKGRVFPKGAAPRASWKPDRIEHRPNRRIRRAASSQSRYLFPHEAFDFVVQCSSSDARAVWTKLLNCLSSFKHGQNISSRILEPRDLRSAVAMYPTRIGLQIWFVIDFKPDATLGEFIHSPFYVVYREV